MKKLLSVLLASVTAMSLGASLVACGGKKNQEEVKEYAPGEITENLPSVTDPNDPIAGESTAPVPECTITVWAPSGAIPAYTEYVKTFTSTYKNGKYANVTVDFQAYGEGDTFAALSTDPEVGADVFFFVSDHIVNLYDAHILQPLSSEGEGEYYTAAIVERDAKSSYAPVTFDGYCWAFPTTADNGWFLWYDSEFFTADDVKTWDGMLAKAKDADKQIMFDYGNGWYLPGFWFGAGVTMDYTNPTTYVANVTSGTGQSVAKAVYKILGTEYNVTANRTQCVIKPSTDLNGEIVEGMTTRDVVAGFVGTWVAGDMPSYAVPTVCPTFTVDGKQVQMGSFMGGKYCGVNAKRPNTSVSMALANFLTNEQGQTVRYGATQSGPSNKEVAKLPVIANNPVLAAFAAQNALGGYLQQKQSPNFWDSWGSFGSQIANGSITESTLLAELKDLEDALCDLG